MNCMKCGREIGETQVFCPACLAEMDKYPVKPGTVVQLPHTPSYAAAKKPAPRRKPALPPEDQVKHLRKWIRRLALALALTVSLLAAGIFLAVRQYTELDNRVIPGQNYSGEDTPTLPGNSNTRR